MPTRPPMFRLRRPRPAKRTVSDEAAYEERRAFANSPLWRKTSKAHLRANPLCAYCEQAGRIRAATLVDHLLAIADGGAKFDPANFRSCCEDCHAEKTAAEIAARRRGEPGKPRRKGVRLDGTPLRWE